MKTTAAMIVAASVTAAAHADVLDASMLTEGQASEQLTIGTTMVDATTSGGSFASKTLGGTEIMGIAGGYVGGEIDATESMRFEFDRPVIVSSLELGALFIDGQHGDRVNERALVTINDRDTFELALTGATSASWTGAGVVASTSPGLEGNAGSFRVAGVDIFDAKVESMTLSAPQEDVPGSRGSDYGFVSMSATPAPVPAPGALALAGIGGLIVVRRRRG